MNADPKMRGSLAHDGSAAKRVRIGRLNRVYEVLTRLRPLTMAMARRLHAQLGISAESLIGEPDAAVR